jgi:hypothetical protein
VGHRPASGAFRPGTGRLLGACSRNRTWIAGLWPPLPRPIASESTSSRAFCGIQDWHRPADRADVSARGDPERVRARPRPGGQAEAGRRVGAQPRPRPGRRGPGRPADPRAEQRRRSGRGHRGVRVQPRPPGRPGGGRAWREVVAAGFYQGGAANVRLGEEFHHNRLSLIASIGAWGAPGRHAPRWDRPRVMATATRLLYTDRVSVEGLARPSVPFDQAGRLPLDRPAPQATVKWRRLLRRGCTGEVECRPSPALGVEDLEVPLANRGAPP